MQRRLASTLLLVESKDGKLASSTLNAVTAAQRLAASTKNPNPIVTALVAASSKDADQVAKEVATIVGVQKVLVANNDCFQRPVAEDLVPYLMAAQASGKYSHIISVHSAFGKNVLPRLAALMDIAPVSDVIEIKSEDTFVRPIYAGRF